MMMIDAVHTFILIVLEANFGRYMQAFAPFLVAALQNHQEHQLCGIAVGLVGDLCRALNDSVQPFCDQFMTLLCQNLQV
jgi:importin subunit beta-1